MRNVTHMTAVSAPAAGVAAPASWAASGSIVSSMDFAARCAAMSDIMADASPCAASISHVMDFWELATVSMFPEWARAILPKARLSAEELASESTNDK
jgi:hypothetical protein